MEEYLDFIRLNYQEILAGHLMEGLVVLNEYGVEDHELALANLLYGHSLHLKDDETLDRFVVLIRRYLVELASQFTIELNEEAALEDLVEVFRNLSDLEHYLDHEAVTRVLESDELALEILATLFELVRGTSTSWTFNTILGFNPKLLERIKETHDKPNETEDLVAEVGADPLKPQLENLRLFKEYIETDSLVAFKLIRRGTQIGLDFKGYLHYLDSHLEYAKDEDLVKELLGILYLGKDSYTNPILTFRDHSEQLFDDLKKISKIDAGLSTLVNSYSSFKVTRRK